MRTKALAQCDRFGLAVADTFRAVAIFDRGLTGQRDNLDPVFQ